MPKSSFDPILPDGITYFGGKGSIPADIMVIGRIYAASITTTKANQVFGGKAVDLLIKSRDMLKPNFLMYFTNFIKERSPDKKITIGKKKIPVALRRKWQPILHDEIRTVSPLKILAIGAEVAEELCHGFKNMREDHGSLFYNKDHDCWVVPTYPFGQAMRNPNIKPGTFRDLERFFLIDNPTPTTYQILEKVTKLPLNQGDKVFLDVETTGYENDEDSDGHR